MGELLGYARVSTTVQDAALQLDALSAAGCWRTWADTASGARTDRPQLAEVMASLRPGRWPADGAHAGEGAAGPEDARRGCH